MPPGLSQTSGIPRKGKVHGCQCQICAWLNGAEVGRNWHVYLYTAWDRLLIVQVSNYMVQEWVLTCSAVLLDVQSYPNAGFEAEWDRCWEKVCGQNWTSDCKYALASGHSSTDKCSCYGGEVVVLELQICHACSSYCREGEVKNS